MALPRIKIQDKSKLNAKGGSISPITEFLVGDRGRQNNIIMDWMKCIVNQRAETAARVLAFKEKNSKYWKKLESRSKRHS